jgi:hypothetical protein
VEMCGKVKSPTSQSQQGLAAQKLLSELTDGHSQDVENPIHLPAQCPGQLPPRLARVFLSNDNPADQELARDLRDLFVVDPNVELQQRVHSKVRINRCPVDALDDSLFAVQPGQQTRRRYW